MAKDLTFLGFISGRGSNLKSLIINCSSANLIGVISDSCEAAGLNFAREQGIPTYPFHRSEYDNKKSFRSAVRTKAKDLSPDFILLAGYMQLLEPEFIELFSGRILNIHPSILPDFPGLNTHQRAIEAGVAYHGCSVHLVDRGVDTGPLIAQSRVPVLVDDTEQTLAARVLKQEHILYPWVVNALINGELSVSSSTVRSTSSLRESARANNFTLFGEDL